MNEPFTYTSEIAIPVEQWGKDHWSTFAYLETLLVDAPGKNAIVHPSRMRTDGGRHPLFTDRRHSAQTDRSCYPTRLRNGELSRHDDWDCLWDACVAGFLELPLWTREETSYYFEIPRGSRGSLKMYDGEFPRDIPIPVPVTIRATEEGIRVAGLLRGHKAKGGNFAEFKL